MHAPESAPPLPRPPVQVWLTRLLVVLLVVGGIAAIAKLVSRSARFAGDHIAYYTAAESILAGKSPYEHDPARMPYIYPPPFAYLAVPLALMPPWIFGLVWGLLLGAGFLMSIHLTRELISDGGRDLHWMVWILPAILLFRAGYSAWSLGNVTLILSPLILGALLLDRRGRTAAAAALLAFASMLKIFPAFVAGALFLRSGRRAGLLWLATFTLLLAIFPALFVGSDRCREQWTEGFLKKAGSNLEEQHTWKQRCAPLPTYWRILELPVGTPLKIATVTWAGLCLVFLLVTSGKAHERRLEDLWEANVLATLLIVTPIISKNYLILLLYPAAVALRHALERPAGDRVRTWLFAGVGLGALFLNMYNPWLVGDELSAWMDRLQPAENCLLVFWLALSASLVAACREKPLSSEG